MSNRRKNNLRHTWKHRKNYVKAFFRGEKFKPSMSNKEHKRLYNEWLAQEQMKEGLSNKKKAIDELCKKLEAKTTLTTNEKIELKEYCLSPENVNVGRVGNFLNTNSENLNNLPVENILKEEKEKLEEVANILEELNSIVDEVYPKEFAFEKTKRLKEKEDKLVELIQGARDTLGEIQTSAKFLNTQNAKNFLKSAEELSDALESIYKEIDAMIIYSKEDAESNLRKGIKYLERKKLVNVSNALKRLSEESNSRYKNLIKSYKQKLDEKELDEARAQIRKSIEEMKRGRFQYAENAVKRLKIKNTNESRMNRVKNIALLAEYGTAMQEHSRRERASRVRRASQGGRGGYTRKRKH